MWKTQIEHSENKDSEKDRQENDGIRRKKDDEIENELDEENIIKYIKKARIRWLWHA